MKKAEGTFLCHGCAEARGLGSESKKSNKNIVKMVTTNGPCHDCGTLWNRNRMFKSIKPQETKIAVNLAGMPGRRRGRKAKNGLRNL